MLYHLKKTLNENISFLFFFKQINIKKTSYRNTELGN